MSTCKNPSKRIKTEVYSGKKMAMAYSRNLISYKGKSHSDKHF